MLERDNLYLFCWEMVGICILFGFWYDFFDSFDEILFEYCDYFIFCDWIVIFLGNNYEFIDFFDKKFFSKGLFFVIGFDFMSLVVEIIMVWVECM